MITFKARPVSSPRFLSVTLAGAAAALMLIAGAAHASGSSFNTIYSFQDTTDGAKPLAPVIIGSDGYLYGTTSAVDYITVNGNQVTTQGSVFRLAADGTETPLYFFGQKGGTTPDGITPNTRVVEGPDGSLYGATQSSIQNGCSGCGMIYKVTAGGSETIINSFSSSSFATNHAGVVSELTLGDDGLLYGNVGYGGPNVCGLTYRMSTAGVVDPNWGFVFGNTPSDGCEPIGGLLKASDGNFYGVTIGGTNYDSTVFRITPLGQFTTLYHSASVPGVVTGRLVQGQDGALYGLSDSGGNAGKGSLYRVTLDGSISLVYQFEGTNDGYHPVGDLALGPDGALYGVTQGKGFFRLTADGQLVSLGQYGFLGTTPPSSLTSDGVGNFYVTTPGGGQYNWGTVSLFSPVAAGGVASESFSATSTTIQLGGGSTTLSWNATNASQCVGFFAGINGSAINWNPNKLTSGSYTYTPSGSAGGTAMFWLECQSQSNPAYWTTRLLTINVLPQPPSVTLTVNPSTIVYSNSATLTWNSVKVTSCTASGAWSGLQSTFGSLVVKPTQVGNNSYTLTCTATDGSTVASTAVLNVTAPPPPTLSFYASTSSGPRKSVSIALGQSVNLQWSTTYAKACRASGAWTGAKSTKGPATVTPSATGSYAYTLSCSGLLSGVATGTVNVQVN